MDTPTTSRRRLLQLGAAALPLAALGAALPAVARAATSPSGATLRMPAETDRHVRTFMAWPALSSIWGTRLDGVRRDIARVAAAISRFEPVVMLARAEQAADARGTCGAGAQFGIDTIAWGGGGIHCATQSQPAVPPVL
ncbi:agmatine deiminase family protein [Streptomyces tanashiensis]|uniref:agmatine deiminase family protein n=1 Tax=Streptomyces tanashiensis TaxID=67367 RepID=UPI0033FFDF8F